MYFSPPIKTEYLRVRRLADSEIILSQHYYRECFLRRNDYLLSHSSRVICYFDGVPRGGTYYTVRRAEHFVNLMQ